MNTDDRTLALRPSVAVYTFSGRTDTTTASPAAKREAGARMTGPPLRRTRVLPLRVKPSTLPSSRFVSPMKYAAKMLDGLLYISMGLPTSWMDPALIRTMRSDTDIASSWSWVTCSTVIPSSLTMRLISYLSSVRTLVSRADSGSSSIRIFEPDASALAMATFCLSPPDSSEGSMPARSSILTSARYFVAVPSLSSIGTALTLSPYSTLRRLSMLGNRAMFWNTYPTSLSSIGTSVTSFPSMSTLPSVGVHMPDTVLIRVVFPQPDGPRMVTYSPSATSRLMFLTA